MIFCFNVRSLIPPRVRFFEEGVLMRWRQPNRLIVGRERWGFKCFKKQGGHEKSLGCDCLASKQNFLLDWNAVQGAGWSLNTSFCARMPDKVVGRSCFSKKGVKKEIRRINDQKFCYFLHVCLPSPDRRGDTVNFDGVFCKAKRKHNLSIKRQ